MVKKTQCEVHEKEIDTLRARSHKHTNEISKLELMHQENCKDIDTIKNDISTIKTNHLTHIENDISELKTDMKWLKKFFFIVTTATIGGLITSILTLILK